MIDTNSLPIKITYVGATRRGEWACDQWQVEFSNSAGYWTTNYFTGLGLRKKPRGNFVGQRSASARFSEAPPVKPAAAEVLHSLILDAQAADYNFNDWCADFGYSSDSIRALNTYQACLETAVNLRKYLGCDIVTQLAGQLRDF